MALPIDTEGHGHRWHADAVELAVLDDDLAGGLVDLPDRAVAQRRGPGSGRRASVVVVLGEGGQGEGEQQGEQQAHGGFLEECFPHCRLPRSTAS